MQVGLWDAGIDERAGNTLSRIAHIKSAKKRFADVIFTLVNQNKPHRALRVTTGIVCFDST